MPDNNDIDIMESEEITKKCMTMFYIVDTSGSMDGTKIGTVNTVMEEVIPEIKGVGGADADIRIAVLDFNSFCTWMYDKPISVYDFTWKKLSANGLTSMGEAFTELSSKLSKKEYMVDAKASWAPILFLLSDGEPTDDYEHGLEVLKKNNWFKSALKVAVAIGDDANKDVLAQFTGTTEAVVQVNNGKALARMIKYISVTSSQIASGASEMKGDTEGITPEEADAAKQDEFNKKLNEGVKPEDIQFDNGW